MNLGVQRPAPGEAMDEDMSMSVPSVPSMSSPEPFPPDDSPEEGAGGEGGEHKKSEAQEEFENEVREQREQDQFLDAIRSHPGSLPPCLQTASGLGMGIGTEARRSHRGMGRDQGPGS